MKLNLSSLILAIVLIFSFCTKNPIQPIDYTDGEYILFIRNKGTLSEICTMKPDGSDVRVIASHDWSGEYVTHRYVRARWSPDKSLIVVEGGPRESNEWNPLWLMDMNGNFIKRLVWAGRRPVWTSDGEFVIYDRRRGYFSVIRDIFKMDINSTKEDTLIIAEDSVPGINSFYMYHLFEIFPNNNNRLLLYEMYTYTDTSGTQHHDPSDIVIYDYLSKSKTYLTYDDVEDGQARLSKNGNMIAYARYDVEYSRYASNLYIMTAQGENVRQLTFSNGDAYLYLAWSPEGKNLMYTKVDRSEGLNFYGDIFTIDVETGLETRLTNTVQDSVIYYVMDWK